MRQQYIRISALGATLEGILHLPADLHPPYAAVVVCHPHPLYGGDMHNNVVAAVCDGLLGSGIAALRFNFRGVGASTGSHTGGPGEQADLLAALAFLVTHPEIASPRIGVAGYSFGAGVVLGAAPPDALAIAAIAPPASSLVPNPLAAWNKPTLLLAGDRDHVVTIADLHRTAATSPGSCTVLNIPGANHFYAGHESAVASAIGDFFARVLAPVA